MSLIRGTSIQGFLDLVRELDADPLEYLTRTHIPLEAVGNHDEFISVRSTIALLELAAVGTKTLDFGRQLASRQGLEILGPVGVAARTAPTFGAAIEAADQYMSVYSPALRTTLHADPTQRYARFDWRIVLDRLPPHPQAAELAIGTTLSVFRLLAGEGFSAEVVHFRHQPLTSEASYASYFGCPVRFGKPATEVLLSPSMLSRPVAADSAVHEVVREYLNSIIVPANTLVLDHVRLLIRRMLPTGGLTLELVASHLAVHARTLQRQLTAEGTTFAHLVEQVRREEAARYLRDTDMPLNQLAGILGYSEQSVLARACQRWFGMSASTIRSGGTRSG